MTQRVQTAVPIFLLVALAIVVTNVFPFRQMMANDQTIEHGLERLDALRAENARLALEVEALATEAELERMARQDLGYVKQGEIAYVITNPAEPEVVVEASEPVVFVDLPWYQKVWHFLTGQDLISTQF